MKRLNKYFATTFAVGLLLVQHGVLAADGKAVYQKWCMPCHADSPFAPGTIKLKASAGAERAALETRSDLTPELIISYVRNGFAGMPKFRRTEISNDELAALVKMLVRHGAEE